MTSQIQEAIASDRSQKEEPPPPLLELREITKSYPNRIHILGPISLIVNEGEFVVKAIFRRQMISSVSLARRIEAEVQNAEEHRVGRETIQEFLGSCFSPEESERQIGTIVDWARYAELFDYDPDADQFFLPESAETT